MKDKPDLVAAWLKKAKSDEESMLGLLDIGKLDTACFHAQQSAEKYLKGFLFYSGILFPFTHNLQKLLQLCAKADERFLSLIPQAEVLTPHAVEFRYDLAFWPTAQECREALEAALAVRDFVLARLPDDLRDRSDNAD